MINLCYFSFPFVLHKITDRHSFAFEPSVTGEVLSLSRNVSLCSTRLLLEEECCPAALQLSVQFACAQFERTFSSFALCPFGLQLFPPLLPFLLGQLGLAETWWMKRTQTQMYLVYDMMTAALQQTLHHISSKGIGLRENYLGFHPPTPNCPRCPSHRQPPHSSPQQPDNTKTQVTHNSFSHFHLVLHVYLLICPAHCALTGGRNIPFFMQLQIHTNLNLQKGSSYLCEMSVSDYAVICLRLSSPWYQLCFSVRRWRTGRSDWPPSMCHHSPSYTRSLAGPPPVRPGWRRLCRCPPPPSHCPSLPPLLNSDTGPLCHWTSCRLRPSLSCSSRSSASSLPWRTTGRPTWTQGQETFFHLVLILGLEKGPGTHTPLSLAFFLEDVTPDQSVFQSSASV